MSSTPFRFVPVRFVTFATLGALMLGSAACGTGGVGPVSSDGDRDASSVSDAGATTHDGANGPAPEVADAAADGGSITDAKRATPLDVSGPVGGANASTVLDAVVLWFVDSRGDYTFNSGSIGKSNGGTFVGRLEDAPPPEAVMGDLFAVGYVTLVDPNDPLPLGKLTGRDWPKKIRGISKRHTIVWRASAPTPVSAPAWLPNFPAGYACSACVANPGTADSLAPASCSAMTVEPVVEGSNEGMCNWN
ncbi:MAG: hypothetical protein U0169_10785 [Polyangiaceae bacterium]